MLSTPRFRYPASQLRFSIVPWVIIQRTWKYIAKVEVVATVETEDSRDSGKIEKKKKKACSCKFITFDTAGSLNNNS